MAIKRQRVKSPRRKSRIAATASGVKTGLRREIDERLTRSFVDFLNGKDGPAAFGWVTNELNRAAQWLEVPGRFDHIQQLPDEDQARKRALAAMSWIASLDSDLFAQDEAAAELRRLMGFPTLAAEIAALQIVHVWRVSRDGTLIDIALPKLDSVTRCCAYVIGLAMLDRHHLRRGIKRCRLPGPVHYFINLPNDKRAYCCARHAATHRKRREREESK